MTTTRPDLHARQFVLGPERVRVTILTTGAETGGRHDVTDSWLPAGSITPLHLDTRALHISTPAGFAELVARAGTPAHLLTPTPSPTSSCSWP